MLVERFVLVLNLLFLYCTAFVKHNSISTILITLPTLSTNTAEELHVKEMQNCALASADHRQDLLMPWHLQISSNTPKQPFRVILIGPD